MEDLLVADVKHVVILHQARFHLAVRIHLVFFLGEAAGVQLAKVFESLLILADVAEKRGNIRQRTLIWLRRGDGIADLLRGRGGPDRDGNNDRCERDDGEWGNPSAHVVRSG